jgi:hypothetical protein
MNSDMAHNNIAVIKRSPDISMPLQIAASSEFSSSSSDHSMAKKSSKIRSELPCLCHPTRPDGVDLAKRQGVLDASFQPSAEQLVEARKWLVETLACRAVEILKKKGT